jgi:hypothetical protein
VVGVYSSGAEAFDMLVALSVVGLIFGVVVDLVALVADSTI